MTTPIPNQSKSDNNGDQKQLYRSLKKKLKVLIYENECFQDELRKCQKELIAIKCDEYFLLDKLLKYEDIQSTSSSDSDATDISESEIDVKHLKPKSTAKRLKTNNGTISQAIESSSSSTAGPLKRKKAKSKGSGAPIASQKSLITYGASHRHKDGVSRGKKNNIDSGSTCSSTSTETPMAVSTVITTSSPPPTPQAQPPTIPNTMATSSGFLKINSLVPNLSVPVSLSNSFNIATASLSATCTTSVPTQSSASSNQSTSLMMAESIAPSITGPTASLLRPNLKVTTTPSPSISVSTTNSMLKFSPLMQTTKLPSILSGSKSPGLSLSVPLKPSSPISTGSFKFSTKSVTTSKLLSPLTTTNSSSISSSTMPVSTAITSSTTIPFINKTESKQLSQTTKSATLLSETTKTVVATTKPAISSTINCKTESMPLIRTTKIPSILLISSAPATSSLPATLTVAKTANSKTTSTFTLQTESKPSIRATNKTPSILLASKISTSSTASVSSSLSSSSTTLSTLHPVSIASSSFSTTTTTLAPTTKSSLTSSFSSSSTTSSVSTTIPKSDASLTSGWYLLTQPVNSSSSESPSILSNQEVSNGGQFTLEEIERHFESRPIQSSLLLPEKTPLTLPSELFSND